MVEAAGTFNALLTCCKSSSCHSSHPRYDACSCCSFFFLITEVAVAAVEVEVAGRFFLFVPSNILVSCIRHAFAHEQYAISC